MIQRLTKQNKRATRLLLVTIFALLFLGILIGSILAKYISINRERAEIVSANFHISSDYLKENGASYSVTDFGYQDYDIIFELYNYETSNHALITAGPIAYTFSDLTGWTVTVRNEDGGIVSPVNYVYTLGAEDGEKHAHTVMLKREQGESTDVTVKITTTAPYKKSLSASFSLSGAHDPSHRIEDCGNYVSVIIESNNYAGDLEVMWSADFSPDNTNPAMRDWVNSLKKGVFSVNAHTTYELIFLKTTTDTYTNGITVSVKGEE